MESGATFELVLAGSLVVVPVFPYLVSRVLPIFNM